MSAIDQKIAAIEDGLDEKIASTHDRLNARRAKDSLLTIQAMSDLADLMREGALPKDLSITRHRIQVVVDAVGHFEPFPEEALAVIQERWPGGTEVLQHRAVHSRKQRKRTKANVLDQYRLEIPLREVDEEAPQWRPDYPPRIEVWGVFRPHVCTRYVGYLDPSKKPRWRCADRGCERVLGVRAARAMGLQP